MDKKPITATFQWDGCLVRLFYCPDYFEVVAHLEICSDDGSPLPITETGYRSHFFVGDEPPSVKEVISFVEEWLVKEANTKKWLEYCETSKQMSLF